MSLEENKAITRRVIEEIWNQRRLELIDELFAQHLNNHGLVVLNGPWGCFSNMGILPAPSVAEQARWRNDLSAILPSQADS
jgi:hypothetical protein